jgi:hypothetical protein
MPFEGTGWKYENCAINKTTCPNYKSKLPDYFVNAKERFIVVRQARALLGRTDEPFDHPLNDVILMSDFVHEIYLPFEDVNNAFNLKDRVLGYVCLVNDPNMKKKKSKYRWSSPEFHFAFASIEGAGVIPSSFLIDFLLVYRY